MSSTTYYSAIYIINRHKNVASKLCMEGYTCEFFTTKHLTTLAEKLKAHKEGDTFGHDGKKYILGPNKHLSVVGGKKTRKKKSNRRTKKKTSKK